MTNETPSKRSLPIRELGDASSSSPAELFDPVPARREAMIDILGSWDLEGALPTGYGLEVVRRYVRGETDIDGAIELLKEHQRNGGFVRHE